MPPREGKESSWAEETGGTRGWTSSWSPAVCGDCLDWLILQVPYAAVFEGDPLVLRCRGWYDKVVYKLHYYRDGQALRYFPSSANYTVAQARASDSGLYQCSGTMRIPVESAPMFSAKVAVTVQGGGGPGPGRAAKSLGILGREPGGERGAEGHVADFPARPPTDIPASYSEWGARMGAAAMVGIAVGLGRGRRSDPVGGEPKLGVRRAVVRCRPF